MGIIFLPAALIITLVGYANNRTAAKVHDHLLLGITLPQAALEEKQVQEAVKGYSRANGICLLLSLLGVLPCFLLGDWVSLLIAYGILWSAGALAAYQQIFIHFHRIVYQMKQERRWFVGERHVLHVDLELSRQKSRLSLPQPILLVPVAATCLIGIFLWVSRKASAASWLLLAGCLFGNLLFFLLSRIVCRGKAKTYCENTAVNLACNRVGYRGWSFCFFLLSLSGSLLTAGVLFLDWVENTAVLYGYCLFSAFLFLGAILFTWKRITGARSRLLEGVKTEEFLVDEDEYWKDGVYRNPQDPRTFVEKRVGYGYTCNLATRKGRRMAYLPFFLLIPFCIGLVSLFAWMDFTPFTLSVQEDLVTVHAPMYQDTFSVKEIEGLSLTDTIPLGKRTGGAATNRYLLGNFQMEGYGTSRLYVYLNEAPAVVIQLSDRTVFYTGKTEEESLRAYQELLRNVDTGGKKVS